MISPLFICDWLYRYRGKYIDKSFFIDESFKQ